MELAIDSSHLEVRNVESHESMAIQSHYCGLCSFVWLEDLDHQPAIVQAHKWMLISIHALKENVQNGSEHPMEAKDQQ